MRTHGYQSYKADADLWNGPAARPNDGCKFNHCCILLYVDDCLCMHHDTQRVLTEIQYFMMKSQDQLEYSLIMGFWAWCMSLSKYIQDFVANIAKYLEDNNGDQKFQKKRVRAPHVPGPKVGLCRKTSPCECSLCKNTD